MSAVEDAIRSWQQGDATRTRMLCAQILAKEPDDVQALNLFAMAAATQGDVEQAIASLQKATALDPNDPALRNNLGNALLAAGQTDAAIDALRFVTQAVPDYADAHCNLGSALQKAGQIRQAINAYRRATECDRKHVRAYYQLGNALRLNHEQAAAIAAYDTAVQLRPDFSEGLQNLAGCLIETGQFGAAVAIAKRLTALRPDSAEAQHLLALAHQGAGGLADAAAAYEAATRIKSRAPYIAGLWRSRRRLCLWSDDEALRTALRSAIASGEPVSPEWIPQLALNSSDALQLMRASHRSLGAETAPLWTGGIYGHRKLRIAYLTGDGWAAPTLRFMHGILEAHDRESFELAAVVWSALPLPQSSGLRAKFDHWVDAREQTDYDVARWMRDAEVDIAVDLQGSVGARPGILARRPAPVQVQYLGFGGTMALPHIDYLIADERLVPRDETQYYTEKLLYLPTAYHLPRDAAQGGAADRVRFGLPADELLLCNLSPSSLLSPQLFSIWMRLLLRMPRSMLCLLDDNRWSADNLRREAARFGVSGERLMFVPPMSEPERLRCLATMDLYLDTAPENDLSGVADALCAGLPPVSLYGSTFWGRRSASLLQAAVPRLINATPEDYETCVMALGASRASRQEISDRLRSTGTTAETFCRQLEHAYRGLLDRCAAGLSPQALQIGP